MNKRELAALANATGMRTGLLVEKAAGRVRRCLSRGEQNGEGCGQGIVIEKAFESALDRQVGIVIAGSAGQKVKSTATLLARAGMLCGLDAIQKDDYPITVMTGHSVSEISLSPGPIEYTAIDKPDYFAVISEDGLKKTRKSIGRLPETLHALCRRVHGAPRHQGAREADRRSRRRPRRSASSRPASSPSRPSWRTPSSFRPRRWRKPSAAISLRRSLRPT